jgi:hypothetical protein
MRISPWWRCLLLFGLLAAAIVSCAAGVRNAWHGSQDFQYSPARILLDHADPYWIWLNGNPDGKIWLSQQPNYAHLLYVVLLPFSALPWPAAKITWACINLLLGITAATAIARRARLTVFAASCLTCIFLASTPFRNAVGNGQQALLILWCTQWAWALRERSALASPFLAVAFAKYTFFFPYGVWFALRGRVQLLATSALYLAIGWIVLSLWAHRTPFATLLEPLRVASGVVGAGEGDLMTIARMADLDQLLFRGASTTIGAAFAITLAIALRNRLMALTEVARMGALGMISLLSVVHLAYDYIFLLPLLATLPNSGRAQRIVIGLGVAYFWFGAKIIDMTIGPQSSLLSVSANWVIGMATLVALFSPGAAAASAP